MKKIYLLFALLMGVCAFTACSDDDDDEKKNDEIVDTDKKDNEMVGTWTLLYDGMKYEDGKGGDKSTYEEMEDVFTFEADGTGKEVITDEGEVEEYTFTYTYENKQLTMIFNDIEEGEGEIEGEVKEVYNVTFKDGMAFATATEADKKSGMYHFMELKKIK